MRTNALYVSVVLTKRCRYVCDIPSLWSRLIKSCGASQAFLAYLVIECPRISGTSEERHTSVALAVMSSRQRSSEQSKGTHMKYVHSSSIGCHCKYSDVSETPTAHTDIEYLHAVPSSLLAQ